MQRHHGALAEADERQCRRRELVPREFGFDEPLQQRCGLVDADPSLVRSAEGQGEPLPPDRRLAARLRRMRRNERGMRQVLLPSAPYLDQVVAVGSITVQEHAQLLGGAGTRRQPRTVKFSGHRYLFPASDSTCVWTCVSALAWLSAWVL